MKDDRYRSWVARLARLDAMLDNNWSKELQGRYNEAQANPPKPVILVETINNTPTHRLRNLVRTKMMEFYGKENWDYYWRKFVTDLGEYSNIPTVIGKHLEVYNA